MSHEFRYKPGDRVRFKHGVRPDPLVGRQGGACAGDHGTILRAGGLLTKSPGYWYRIDVDSHGAGNFTADQFEWCPPTLGAVVEAADRAQYHAQRATDFDAAVQAVYDEARKVLLERHKKYGPKNIAGAPGGPLNGLRVRMWDKLARINHALDKWADLERDPEYGGSFEDFADDKFRDAFLDLANYAIIGLMVVDKKWPR
jgi:hypothetical protein